MMNETDGLDKRLRATLREFEEERRTWEQIRAETRSPDIQSLCEQHIHDLNRILTVARSHLQRLETNSTNR